MDDYDGIWLLMLVIGLMTFVTTVICTTVYSKTKEDVQDQRVCETNETWNSTGTYQWKMTE
jgi:heme/copper-type cytochrome/quinol oxidase subunit 2